MAPSLVLPASFASRSSSWSVGLNECWVVARMLDANVSCAECPTNQQARSLAEAECRILDLAAQQHVGAFREIIPLELVQGDADFNSPRNAQTRGLALEVLRLYAAYNVTLVLAFDRPVPAWMAPEPWCPIPVLGDDAGWAALKDAVSWAEARFVAWLAQSLPAAWMRTHLLIEPWNEFDAVASSAACEFPSTAPSPARSADLTGGVNFALLHAGFSPDTVPMLVASSVTGSYPGLPWPQYMAAYYAAGGTGLPSIHVYSCDAAVVVSTVRQVAAQLPPALQSLIVLGETGCPLATASCTTGGTEDARAAFLHGVAQDPTVVAATSLVLFWRTLDLTATTLGCEGTFGAVDHLNGAYDEAFSGLFRTLGGTGASHSCAAAAATRAPPPLPSPPPCSLNGVLQPSGECVCRAGWEGPTCRTMSLLPAAPLTPDAQVYLHKGDNSWGISVLPDDTQPLFHGYMTELQYGCSLAEYSLASRVLHLTAPSLAGPWTVQGVALAAFAHNPQVVRDRDGAWLLFHIGSALPPSCNMSCESGKPVVNGSCPTTGHGTSVARATSPYGPWTRVNYVLPDNSTNPSALVLPNGTIVVTARRWTWGVPLYMAESWQGPYRMVGNVTVVPVDATADAATTTTAFDEDPYLYQDAGGFHMLTHRQPSGVNCPAQGNTPDDCRCAGGHMYAESLFGPWFLDLSLVYNCTLAVAGSSAAVHLHARQRPTLYRTPSGCPVLFTGASTDPVSQYYSSFTMVQFTQCP